MSPGKGCFGLFWKVPEGVVPTLTADLRPVNEGRSSRRHIISLDLTRGMEMGAIQLKNMYWASIIWWNYISGRKLLKLVCKAKKTSRYSIKLLKGTFQLSWNLNWSPKQKITNIHMSDFSKNINPWKIQDRKTR